MKKKLILDKMDRLAIPDAMMFYPPLYLLHVVAVIVTLLVSIYAFVAKSPRSAEIIPFVASLCVATVFAGYCLGPYYPKRMKDLIERQRAIWQLAVEDTKWRTLKAGG
jgi:hypothetical protein